ncbi:hypothetical protein J6590_032203 [Homalodisca vitripennis]|nr:hypothetical protein J6590_032203 [Homalodisca vitripennis]
MLVCDEAGLCNMQILPVFGVLLRISLRGDGKHTNPKMSSSSFRIQTTKEICLIHPAAIQCNLDEGVSHCLIKCTKSVPLRLQIPHQAEVGIECNRSEETYADPAPDSAPSATPRTEDDSPRMLYYEVI